MGRGFSDDGKSERDESSPRRSRSRGGEWSHGDDDDDNTGRSRKRERLSDSIETISSKGDASTSGAKKRKSKWDVPAPATANQLVPTVTATLPPAVDGGLEDRKHRRLYIGNLPANATEQEVVQFFNGALLAATNRDVSAATTPTVGVDLPVLRAEVFFPEHRYCFIEFRTAADTDTCLGFDGIMYNGFPLRIGRPNDYVPPAGTASGKPISAGTERMEHRLYITEIPTSYTEQQMEILLQKFGPLKHCGLVKDPTTGKSRGFGFFEFSDPSVTDTAIKELNGLELEGQKLKVVRASTAAAPGVPAPPMNNIPVTSSVVAELPASMTQRILSNPIIGAQVKAGRKIGETPTNVVQLLNTVYQEDLLNDNEYEEILEDIRREASKFGSLENVLIPRPPPDLSYKEGIGKVFLHYSDVTSARKAQLEFNGRRFDQRRVVCASFYPLDRFLQQRYTLA